MEIVIIIIGGILVWFLKDYFKLKQKIKDGGGMKKKYSYLIDFLLKGNDCSIIKEESFAIYIGIAKQQVSTQNDAIDFELKISNRNYFTITETLGSNLIVEWYYDIFGYGKHTMKWTFSEYTTPHMKEQIEILEKIKSNLEQYYQKNNIYDSTNLFYEKSKFENDARMFNL